MQYYLKTFREVLRRPGNLIDNFIYQREGRFQHPFSFGLMGVFAGIAVNILLVDLNFDIQTLTVESGGDQVKRLTYWIEWSRMKASGEFLPLTIFLLLIPSLSIPGLFFFREDLHGFYANLILNSYAVGASLVALLLLIPVWLISGSQLQYPGFVSTYLPGLLVGGIILWIYKKYPLTESYLGWIRVLSSYIVGYILFLLLKSFATTVVGYFIFAVKRFIEIWTQM